MNALYFFTLVPFLVQSILCQRDEKILGGKALQIENFLESCWQVRPMAQRRKNTAPDVDIMFSLNRLLNIGDVDGTVSVYGWLSLQWVSGCTEEYLDPNDEYANKRLLQFQDVGQVWHPDVIFLDSADDVFLRSPQLGNSVTMDYRKAIMKQIKTTWSRFGTFTAQCRMNLTKYPFDEQKCSFTFMLQGNSTEIEFRNGSLKIDDYLGANIPWTLAGSESNIVDIEQNSPAGYTISSSFVISIKLIRQPGYYLYNLVAPCLLLSALAMASFLLSPDSSDRPTFCVTLLLALTVAQSQVVGQIPVTSQSVLLADYVFWLTTFTAGCVLYQLALFCYIDCSSAETKARYDEPVGKCFRMRRVRFIDSFFFAIAFGAYVGIHVWSASIAGFIKLK